MNMVLVSDNELMYVDGGLGVKEFFVGYIASKAVDRILRPPTAVENQRTQQTLDARRYAAARRRNEGSGGWNP